MAAPTSTSASLSLAVAHAISFLTRPLIASHSAIAIIKLQLVLEANLTALYAPTWGVKGPLRSSARCYLTLSPRCLPPRPIYSACVAAGVQWFEWIALLGNQQFDLFVEPGCVSIHLACDDVAEGRFLTVWVDEAEIETLGAPRVPHVQSGAQIQQSKTLAQQLLEDDHEDDDQLFAMINDEIRAPTWMTPVHAEFPDSVRSLSPLSTHSRSSSRSSNSSSGFSLTSADSSATSLSANSFPASPEHKGAKQSRRERARQARVFVDTSKTEVTPYDGGKTTVLTGGVMLGGGPRGACKPNKVARPSNGAATSWRASRA